LKDRIVTRIRENSGTPWSALRNLIKNAIASDFVRKVAETFATRIFLIGIGLVTGVLVARILGPEGRGLYAVAVTLATTGVQLGNLGLHASNTYFVAKDPTVLPSLVGNTVFVTAFFGITSVALWVVFTTWQGLAPVQGPLLALSLAWIPFGLAYLLFQNILLGINEVRSYNKIELVMQIASVALLALVVFFKIVRVELVFLTGLITILFSAVWTLSIIRKHLTEKPAVSIVLFKNNLRYGIKAYIAAFLAFLVLRADLLMVKYMLGAEQAGYYSIAVAMADMVYMLPVVIATILFPRLSSMNNITDKWNFSRRAIFSTSLIMALVSGSAALAAGPVIRILFGNAYDPAVPAFIWLMPGILFMGIQAVAVQFLNSEGFPPAIIAIWALAFLVNIGLNLFAIPAYGIKGASIVSSISYFFVFVSVIFIIRRVLHEDK
jgi:O-antigen/teichoic acid export membrane protein